MLRKASFMLPHQLSTQSVATQWMAGYYKNTPNNNNSNKTPLNNTTTTPQHNRVSYSCFSPLHIKRRINSDNNFLGN